VRNGDVSFWWHHLGLPAPHEPLAGDVDADVCIVGAGLTGLWTAYYLAEADPGLQIVVCEQRFAGYGASGRNGGWLTGALAGSRERFEATHGRAGVLALQEAMHQAVDEVIAVCAAQGIDADLVKGGELQVATSPAQLHRVRAAVTEDRRWGLVDTELLDAGAVAERVRVSGALGGSFTPHCARLHPVKLVAGLATLVRGRGVAIYEQTPVTGIEPGLVRTAAGTVHAPVVLRATEGFTARLPGLRRTWLPMNSSLVVTEPLEADVWAEIGWAGSETLGDAAHGYCYAQRTADGRIALGGRGKPYRFGSRVDTDGQTPQATVDALQSLLHRLFPAAAGVPFSTRMGRRARSAAGLVLHRGVRPENRVEMGRWVRRARGHHHQPRRSHAARSGARPRQRPHRAAVGGSPGAPLGAGTAALAGRERALHRLPGGRPARVPTRGRSAHRDAGACCRPDLRSPLSGERRLTRCRTSRA